MTDRILVTHWVEEEVLDRLRQVGAVDANPARETWPAGEVARRAADATAMMAFMPDTVDAAFLDAAPRLKVIACALKGFDNFDVAACTARGVHVSIVPDLLTEPTAELAVGLAIGLGRNIREGDALVRAGGFAGWRPILYGFGLDGSTVGILGFGAVGRAIARRLQGFGCEIIWHDPAAEGSTGFHDLLARSDLLICAAPLTPATRHMVGRDALAFLRPGALLVNVGRGSVVDEAAVLAALEMGLLGGYAADVFEFEDWALADRPREVAPALRTHPRTLWTPHLGSAVVAVRRAIAERAADNILDALAGRRPRDAINRA
ncbi:MAG: hydroxyacid dehydrogenase [Acetobacteraceae bacterium]|nr:hydroxyacid dehydrogenase [Acetobacteraceae bacterium]